MNKESKMKADVMEDWFREENVLSCFGRDTFRTHQKEVMMDISKAFDEGYQCVILDAPTGSGKSEIGASFARAAKDAHILTPQKILQDQYSISFPDFFSMKGRSAYPCTSDEPGETCATGICRRRKAVANPDCPYKLAKDKAKASDVTVHNFDSFFYQNSYGEGYGGRKLLIIDEAHNIPNKFSTFLSFTIDSRSGIQVPEATMIEEYDDFVRATAADYRLEYNMLQQLFEAAELSVEQLSRMHDLGQSLWRMDKYLVERSKDRPTEFVFDFKEDGRYGPNVTFRPVMVGKFAREWLFNYGERIILMSATILDKEIFCREVGLDSSTTYYKSVPSTFPPEHRPIIKKYAGPMSYRYIDETLPNIIDIVQRIVDRFPGRKGIIQTHSEKIASYLQRNLFDARFTFNKSFHRPQEMLDYHRSKEGSIIVASGLREGLDLRGDLSKVQIFCKVPYPSMGDKVVKRKMELDPNWYGWITSVMFVQSLGRSVRSPKEKAVTYILDSGFGGFYKRNKRFIPKYIQEAIK